MTQRGENPGPFCMVVLTTGPGGDWIGVKEVYGPFQHVEQLMDYVFGQGTLLRAHAELILVNTNIPFLVNNEAFVISDLNNPFTEGVPHLNRKRGGTHGTSK